MQTTQMNVRIDKSLKLRGDGALSRAGYTPTDAIRLLWTWAAGLSHRPEEIERVLGGQLAATSDKQAEVDHLIASTQKASLLVQSFREANQLSASSELPYMSDKSLKEEALLERYAEKGLL